MVLEQKSKASSEKALKKIKCLQENLKILKQQTKHNNEANERNRDLLNSLSKPNNSSSNNSQPSTTSAILNSFNSNKENKYSHLKNARKYDFEKTAPVYSVNSNAQAVLPKPNISKVNRDLIEYVKFRETYLGHINYWEQIWLFTDNPIYEYEHSEGFENPTYSYLNAKKVFELELEEKLNSLGTTSSPNIFTSESLPTITAQSNLYLNQTFKYQQRLFQNYSSVMNLYESILDVNNETGLVNSASIPAVLSATSKNNNNNSRLISSPSSSDSGIHSDDLLSRSSTIKDQLCGDMKKSSTKSSEDSLYSSVLGSTKKSTDSLSGQLDSEEITCVDEGTGEEVVHLEQHEMPLGWIRCADESGIYYWHKPTGTVTRKPPARKQTEQEQVMAPPVPKKNFKIDEYSSFQQINELINGNLSDMNTLSSPSSTSTSSSSESKHDMEHNMYETAEDIDLNSVSSVSLAMSEPNNNKGGISQSSSILSQQSPTEGEQKKPMVSQRFYVRSLGWVKIDENDLTPERSSKAVNRCINDLSRGHKDLNDVVASWGEGKDLYMDLEENYLILVDTNNNTVLNKQSITSIRVWGVGRDNGRDFAYVARDKHTKIHMCHVFRCDSAPAKEIANSLRDTCRRIINEKKKLKSSPTSQQDSPSSLLKQRTNFLPDMFSPKNSAFSRYSKSTSYQNGNELKGQQLPKSQTESDGLKFVSAMDEPKKTISCKYLGSTCVGKPSGMDVLNDAIEKIYVKSLEDLKRTRKQIRNRNQSLFKKNDFFNDKNDYEDEDEDEDEEYENYENYDYRDNAFSLESLDLNNDKRLGTDVEVVVSPSTVSVKNKYSISSSDDEGLILECRIRYLSFMGISNDVRLCGFIVHCIDNTFKCHAFLCENSSGGLMKLIEAACRLRYQKCLDAHPEASQANNSARTKEGDRLGFIGSQIKGMFDSLKSRNIFSNYSLAETTSSQN